MAPKHTYLLLTLGRDDRLTRALHSRQGLHGPSGTPACAALGQSPLRSRIATDHLSTKFTADLEGGGPGGHVSLLQCYEYERQPTIPSLLLLIL